MIPVNTPDLSGNEKKYLLECIETGWISSEGPFVQKFEQKMAEISERKFGVAMANGSVALDAAFQALALRQDSEVIMPTFTIISCVSAVIRAGLKPVFVDCDPLTFNLRPSDVAAKITSKTSAVMVVHIYGLAVDMDPILELCRDHKLALVEDAAEMHGQKYKGRACGSFGDLSIFSFYPNKHVTSGEGGMVMTNSSELDRRLRSIRNLCFVPEKRFLHHELGHNFRLTNLQAALGLAQTERLESFIAKKREQGAFYSQHLSELSDVFQLPQPEASGSENIYWVYPLVLKSKLGVNAEFAMKKLAAKKIGTRPFFYPMHLQPVLKKMGLTGNDSLPHAEAAAEYGFYIPTGTGMTQDQAVQVVSALKEFVHECV